MTRLSVPVFIQFAVPVLVRETMKESLTDALQQFSANVNFVYGKLPKANKVLEYEIELTPAVPEFKSKFISLRDVIIKIN